jgi:hypothetical protein
MDFTTNLEAIISIPYPENPNMKIFMKNGLMYALVI